jgi:RNA polymerase sigma-70 factor (ECF subfamily)
MPEDYNKFVEKAISGDKEAFGELYRFFLNRIYRFIYYLVGDEFSAEDITQNTFLKAWNSLPNFSIDRGTFQSYLYTIARNLVIDSQRKKKEISLEGEFGDTIAFEEEPEKDIWRKESMQKVRDVLKVLPDLDRQLVVLRFFEDMHFDEISEVLGKKPGALRVRIHRVLETLRASLEGQI